MQLAPVCAVLALAAGAAPAAPGGGVGALRAQAQSLGSQEHRALLGLYSLDAELQDARSRLTALQTQATQLHAQQLRLVQSLSATQHSLHTSQRNLAANLRTLYKRGDVSTLAVVLGAQSLDAAVTELDDLRSIADENERVVAVTTAASARLERLRATISAHRARIATALADASRTASRLAATRDSRVAFIAALRTRERLTTSRIATLETAAQASVQKSQELSAAAAAGDAAAGGGSTATTTATTDAAPPAADPAPSPPPTSGGRTLVVSSTGYSLPGRTATGLPVGWGIVAVDPNVIPLGTRLTIPGYGEGVAADTGGAVRGAMIDLWFPTLGQARAWGRRTVTITLH